MPRICRIGEDIRQKAAHGKQQVYDRETRRRTRESVLTAYCFLPSAFFVLSATAKLVDLFDEVVNVLLLDDARRDENLFGRGDHRAVAAENLRHHLYGLVAELIRLLDDCALDVALAYAFQ